MEKMMGIKMNTDEQSLLVLILVNTQLQSPSALALGTGGLHALRLSEGIEYDLCRSTIVDCAAPLDQLGAAAMDMQCWAH